MTDEPQKIIRLNDAFRKSIGQGGHFYTGNKVVWENPKPPLPGIYRGKVVLDFQTTFTSVYMAPGILALPPEDRLQVFYLVRTFNAFSEGDDPYGEHDFGAFDYKDDRVFWKIDYYDPDMEHGSEDPADPEKTMRVMRVMMVMMGWEY